MRKKGLCLSVIFLIVVGFSAPGRAREQTPPPAAPTLEAAVQLARGGEYEKALALFERLAAAGRQDEAFFRDYITVLSWAGQKDAAVRMAEARYARGYDLLPSYVLKALADAYASQNDAAEAAAIWRILAARGVPDAALQYAEQLMATGDLTAADRAYEAAAKEPKTPAWRIAYSRSLANLRRGDFIAAGEYLAAAKAALAGDPEREKIVRDMDARSAALLIQGGEPGDAKQLLETYIAAGAATPRMTADYLIALRYEGKPALAAFEKLFPNWDQAPLYGLQSMGDAYFRQQQYRRAEKVYDYLLRRDAKLVYAKAARAYCLAMLGREEEALDEYRIIAAREPALHPALAADGRSFVASGRIRLARRLFALLGATPAEKNEYQYQYAQALTLHGAYVESGRIYRALGRDAAFEGKALAGLAENAVEQGLYQDAAELLRRSETKYGATAAYSLARVAYAGRTVGGVTGWFTHVADYKGNDNNLYGIDRENYIGGNFYLLSGVERLQLRNGEDRAYLTQWRTGVSYRYGRGRADIAGVRTAGDYRADAVELYTKYHPNDLAELSFRMNRRPHGEAGAARRGIDELYKSVRWEQRLDRKNTFALEYEWDSLSDGNRLVAYSGEFAHNTLNTSYSPLLKEERANLNPAKINQVLLNYSWSGYDFASPYYESPQRSMNFGLGYSQKWLLPRKGRSWEWIVMAAWGHDNDEPMDFTPYTRLAFTQDLPANQSLSLGAEYGWRTDRLNRVSRLLHGYSQIDFTYNWEW